MSDVEQHRTFTTTIDDARQAAWDALATLGAEVTVSDDGTSLEAKTGWSLFSFGEVVHVDLQTQGDEVEATVKSRQNRAQMLDVSRRNHKNVGSVLTAMSARLG